MSGDREKMTEEAGVPRRSLAGILEQLRAHGCMEGNLSARYSRLRQRMPAITPGEWLYYAGGATLKRSPNSARYAGLILKALEFPAGVMRFEGCSGQDLMPLGFPDLVRSVAGMTASLIRETGACGVICGSPRDAWMFQAMYPVWDLDLEVPVTTASVLLATLFREDLLHLAPSDEQPATVFCGALDSQAGLQDDNPFQPLFAALFGRPLPGVPVAYPCPAGEDSERPLPSDEAFAALASTYGDAAARIGAERIITDDPYSFEALYNHLDGSRIEVLDFCQAVYQSMAR